MTSNKNSVLLIFMGIAIMVLGGCKTTPYKPWQPGDSWWEKEGAATGEPVMSQTNEPEPDDEPVQIQDYTPAQPASLRTDSEPSYESYQPAPVQPDPVQPVPVQPETPKMTEMPVQAPQSMPVAQPQPVIEQAPVSTMRQSADIETETPMELTPPPMVIRQPDIPLASKMPAPGASSGDVLLIDGIQSTRGVTTPRNGQTMDYVRRQFGAPISEGVGIGDPPITRWQYPSFSVYFEHDMVLHTVVHRPTGN